MTFKMRAGLILVLSFATVPAQAGHMTIDGTLAGAYEKDASGAATHSVNWRGQFGLYFGETPEFGPLVHYEAPLAGTHAYILGGGLRFGNRTFFEIGGGALTQITGGVREKGWAVIAKPGLSAQLWGNWLLRLSLPIVIKRASSSPSPHTTVDYMPFVGIALPI